MRGTDRGGLALGARSGVRGDNRLIRIAITGSGMLAGALLDASRARGWDAMLLPRAAVDVTDAAAVDRALDALRPELVFHAAALTRVNHCEEHPDEALAVNRDGTANVARATARQNGLLVYFSTDYVFDGHKSTPYIETDSPNPLNAYGASKLAGEDAARLCPRVRVVRTSGIFGPANALRSDGGHGVERNFMRAIFEQLAAGRNPRVVSDQHTAVTYAPHLAEIVLELLPEPPPLMHITSAGADSWHGWACALARAAGFDPQRVEPVATEPSPAVARPMYSVLRTALPSAASLIERFPATDGIAAYARHLRETADTGTL